MWIPVRDVELSIIVTPSDDTVIDPLVVTASTVM
jgi:hypothetical protein